MVVPAAASVLLGSAFVILLFERRKDALGSEWSRVCTGLPRSAGSASFAGVGCANIEDVIQGLSLLLLEVQVGQLRRQQHRKATLMHLIYSIVHVWRNLKEYSRVEYIVLSKYKECMGPLVCYEWGQYEMIYILILYCIFIFAKKKKRNPRIISKYILVSSTTAY